MRPENMGYLPKIEYWTSKLMEAVKTKDIYEIDSIHRKLDYFIQKQWDLNVKIKQHDESIKLARKASEEDNQNGKVI